MSDLFKSTSFVPRGFNLFHKFRTTLKLFTASRWASNIAARKGSPLSFSVIQPLEAKTPLGCTTPKGVIHLLASGNPAVMASQL
jgi:hypothetical protein